MVIFNILQENLNKIFWPTQYIPAQVDYLTAKSRKKIFRNDPNMRKPACGAIFKGPRARILAWALSGIDRSVSKEKYSPQNGYKDPRQKEITFLVGGNSFRKIGKYIGQVWYSWALLSCKFESCGLGFYSLR